ncbi:class I SAM-dependent methyltransferase [Litorisediminicola beolgyonensis]|uniref:Class I SAM-dependent methyltransferase n=1 Tax=Litorisediminicola beolgyonensis TaxID=1173614 RepID=A0ABW3ZM23_9RHOB
MKDISEGIRARLGLENPFDTYVHDPSRIDRQGWNSRHGFFEVAIEAAAPRLIIELGVWKGMSSIHMAEIVKARGLGAEILAVDTWLGSSNHLAKPGRREELHPVDGYPSVYRTFLANVVDAGHQDVIVPLPMDGNSAAYALNKLGVKAGVIHIDASHEYASCLADLRNYWPLLADDGILIADDYGSWPGVSRAVCEFAAEVDRPLFGSMSKALLPKSPTLGFDLKVTRKRSYRRGDK